MSKDVNQFKSPVPGLDYDLEGPTADHLIDTSEWETKSVYTHIHALQDEWEVVDVSEATPYLPKRKTPLPVIVGIDEKKEYDLGTFEHIKLSEQLKYKKGYVINTGINIWGLDFVPKTPVMEEEDSKIQYLAVTGYRGSTEEHIGIGDIQPTGTYKNAIQIWKLSLSVHEQVDPVLDMCLLHDFGVIFDLKWCPYGTYQEKEKDGLGKLGILSFTCGDNTVRTLVVPHPDGVRRHMLSQPNASTIYLKVKSPRVTLGIASSQPLFIAWGGHKKLAVGCSTGSVIVWDMASILRDNERRDAQKTRVDILLSILVLDAAVSSVIFNGRYKADKLVVTGYDGRTMLVDLSDPTIGYTVMRSRNLMKATTWASHAPCFVFTDNDNISRAFGVNEDGTTHMSKYGDTPGMCWQMASSEHHGQFALCTSVGWVRTSNLYYAKMRALFLSQVCVYKLEYSEETHKFRYLDGIPSQTMEDSKKLTSYEQYGDSFHAIQKLSWNPNKKTSAFLASGGAAGLCRIEFEGRGSKWE